MWEKVNIRNYNRTSSSLNRDVFHDMKYPLYEYKICMNIKKLGSRERAKEGEGRQRHHNLRSQRSCHENVTSGGDGEFNLFSVAFNLQSFRDTVRETKWNGRNVTSMKTMKLKKFSNVRRRADKCGVITSELLSLSSSSSKRSDDRARDDRSVWHQFPFVADFFHCRKPHKNEQPQSLLASGSIIVTVRGPPPSEVRG